MKAFAQGLLDSGRGELARQFLNDLEGGARDAFDEVLGGKAAESRWLEVKGLIDQGMLKATWDRSFEILHAMAQSDREGALDWFVSLDQGDEVSREKRISLAASSGGVFEISRPRNEGPFAQGSRYDRDEARNWLDKMEARGEPVRYARMAQFREAIRLHDWEWVRRDREYLNASEWRKFEESVVEAAVTLESESVRGEKISWASVNEGSGWVEAGREFGLLERVDAVVEERNREARAQLRAIVEKVEEEAGR